MVHKAGGRAVDLRGPSVYNGGEGGKVTKAAVFKRVSLLIEGGRTPLAPALIVHINALYFPVCLMSNCIFFSCLTEDRPGLVCIYSF